MRLLSREKINSMSESEKLKMVENIKVSNLTFEEKEANLKLLQKELDRNNIVLKDMLEGQADIDDITD